MAVGRRARANGYLQQLSTKLALSYLPAIRRASYPPAIRQLSAWMSWQDIRSSSCVRLDILQLSSRYPYVMCQSRVTAQCHV